MKTNTATVYVGVDVAKATLQVHQQGRQTELNIAPAGLTKFCNRLKALEGAHVICEATGGYERALVQALHKVKIPVSVVNPARVRGAAQAQWLKQLVEAQATAKTQAEHYEDPFVRQHHDQMLEHLQSQIQAVEAK